jgi:hypothetical protein
MTSCRYLLTCAAVLALQACAAVTVGNSTIEVLDQETGITVTRLARPLELTVTEGRGPTGDPFGYLGVFQTNRMGARAEYLWIAVPVDGTLAGIPSIEIDGAPLALPGGTNSPDIANLKSPPYQPPAPWSQQFFFPIDASTTVRLASAARLAIQSQDNAGKWSFVTAPEAQAALASYLETR